MLTLHWIDHLFAFALTIVAPAFAFAQGKVHLDPAEMNLLTKKYIYQTNSLFLWAIAGLALFIWFFFDRSWGLLGFQTPQYKLTLSHWTPHVVAIFIAAYALDIYLNMATAAKRQKAKAHWLHSAPFMPSNMLEWRYFAILAFSAACTEEIVFRGYLITYFAHLLGGTEQAALGGMLVSSMVFALLHFYQGGKSVAKIVIFAFGFSALFVLTQSLFWPVLIHLVVDLLSGYLTMRLFRENAES